MSKDELSIDSRVDEILARQYSMSILQAGSDDKHRDYAKQALFQLLLEVIGFDDDVNSKINQESEEDLLITLQEIANNRLRQEQRTKLHQLFNIKEK